MSDKLRLFMYGAVLHKKEVRDGKTEYTGAEILIEPKWIMAANEKAVGFKAAREIPEAAAADPDNVEIYIKPF